MHSLTAKEIFRKGLYFLKFSDIHRRIHSKFSLLDNK